MLLAYLSFMVYPYDLFRAGAAALWIVVFLWFTVAFFWFTSRFFPRGLLKHAFYLWLIVWAQAVWTLTKLPPYWIVSVFFLTPVSFLEETARVGQARKISKQIPRSQSFSSRRQKGGMGPSKRSFWERKKKLGRYFFERALSGIGFVVFVIALVFVREVAERRLGIRAFDQPAAMLMVVAAVAFLWKNQPYQNKGQCPSGGGSKAEKV